jgi:hypothetical protein
LVPPSSFKTQTRDKPMCGTTLDFCDIGIPTSLGTVGAIDGTFDIDDNGNIETISIEVTANDGKRYWHTFEVPYGPDYSHPDAYFAKLIACEIKTAYFFSINDAVNDIASTRGEREYEAAE